MENKQTAVEWLVEQILVKMEDYLNDDYEFDLSKTPKIKYYNAFIDSHDLSKYVNEAKQMEKEQMIEFTDKVIDNTIGDLILLYSVEKIYNETYGK